MSLDESNLIKVQLLSSEERSYIRGGTETYSVRGLATINHLTLYGRPRKSYYIRIYSDQITNNYQRYE